MRHIIPFLSFFLAKNYNTAFQQSPWGQLVLACSIITKLNKDPNLTIFSPFHIVWQTKQNIFTVPNKVNIRKLREDK